MRWNDAAVRLIAAAALLAEIVIHAYLAPDHLREMPYIGVSFVLASIALTGVLGWLLARPADPRPWLAGALLCVGMGALFVVSRTAGLPDYHEAWTSDNALGLWGLPPEAVFVACAVRAVPAARWRTVL